MVCEWRVQDTTDYMERRYKSKKEKEDSKSICKKFGQFISKLFVIGVVLMLVGPSIYDAYEDFNKPVATERNEERPAQRQHE